MFCLTPLDASFIQGWLCEGSWLFGKGWVAELSSSSKWWYCFMSNFSLINMIFRGKKAFKFRETVKLTVANVHLPKLWISFESLNFIIGSKYCHLFFLKWQISLTLFTVKKVSAKSPRLDNLSCQPFFLVKKKKKKNHIMWEKMCPKHVKLTICLSTVASSFKPFNSSRGNGNLWVQPSLVYIVSGYPSYIVRPCLKIN